MDGTPTQDAQPSTDLSWVDWLRTRASEAPDDTALLFLQEGETEAGRLTYRELDLQARSIAVRLRRLVPPGERAMLLYPPGLDYVAAFFGCLYAGIIAIPAYPPGASLHALRLRKILDDAQASLVMTTSAQLAAVEIRLCEDNGVASVRHFVVTDAEYLSPDEWIRPAVTGATIAYLQYTSGSTGSPKGVMVTHRNLLHNCEQNAHAWGRKEKQISVSWCPIFHDMGLIMGVLMPLYGGGTCILMPSVSFIQKPVRWLSAISRYRANTSYGPNFSYAHCVQQVSTEERKGLDLACWVQAVNGAEPVRAETIDEFSEMFAPYGFRREAFRPGYGMAESTLMISMGPTGHLPAYLAVNSAALERHQVVRAPTAEAGRTLVGCGQAWLEQQIRIVDPTTLTECTAGCVGEIWASGASMALGYWAREEETRETFHAHIAATGEGPYLRTGDMGFLHDGQLYITGRLKDLIIVRGTNHYPQDIEYTVEKSYPAFRPAGGAAFSVDADGEERLVVVQEIKRDKRKSFDAAQAVKAIRQRVSEQHGLQVYAVVFIKPASLPKTSSGKVQRRACRASFLSGSMEHIAIWRLDDVPQTAAEDLRADKARPAPDAAAIRHHLTVEVARRLGILPRELDLSAPLSQYGMDSVAAAGIAGELAAWLGRPLSPAIVYDYPSIALLSEHLAQHAGAKPPGETADAQPMQLEPVAIIGYGCRFPGADSPQAYWQMLRAGVDAISEVPADRWDVDALYDPTPATSGRMSTRWGGFLQDVDRFDAQFFGIAPREAESMDPQQRMLLEVSWQALENAGISPASLAGTGTGVFVGISTQDYTRLQCRQGQGKDAYSGTGNAFSIAANRLSYFLDLRGPSVAVDTACSSSLVAVHQACQSLRQHESTLALVGGVNLTLSPDLTVVFSQARMMASDGRCKTFDAAADGYVRGEGCGIVVLKRYAEAVRDGDRIHAVIRGSAINHDGRSNGITAPNGPAQQAVVRQALRSAGVVPADISYVEAHGTGTALGDPIEINALAEVLLQDRSPAARCCLGSVKANIGHLEAAAGIAGLIKTILMLQHGEIPPQLNFKRLNPLITLDGSTLTIPVKLQGWPNAVKRIAGVSSFGFGGTNAHVVVEEAEQTAPSAAAPVRDWHLLCLSAKSPTALHDLARSYADFLEEPTTSELLGDVCYTTNAGRAHFPWRLSVVGESATELGEKLHAFKTGMQVDGLSHSGSADGPIKSVTFLYTGQGSQYIGMGRELYETQPVFRDNLNRCAEILRAHLDKPLLQVIYPDAGADADLLDNTAYTQPALFAIEYALTQMWISWGVTPDAVMGHSVGEYVAACIAGVFTLEDGLRLITMRGRLMQATPGHGEMVAIVASPDTVRSVIAAAAAAVDIAAVNGPESVVISGDRQAVALVVSLLADAGIKTRRLQVSHAFHSRLMDSMLPEFEQEAQKIAYCSPRVSLISNVTGKLAGAEIASAAYWVNHVRAPVQFAAGMRTLRELDYGLFVEIGPTPTLLGMAAQCYPEGVWLPSLRRDLPDWQQLAYSVGELYVRGASIAWTEVDRGFRRRRVDLPGYAFQRQRYWIPDALGPITSPIAHPATANQLLGSRIPLADSGEARFMACISATSPAFLADHRVYEATVVPATAYIEMALSAAADVAGHGRLTLRNIAFQKALSLDTDVAYTTQVVLAPLDAGVYRFQIFSRREGPADVDSSSAWHLHAGGEAFAEVQASSLSIQDLGSWQTRVTEEIQVSDYYQLNRERGIAYGPRFQAIQRLWRNADEALAWIEGAAEVQLEASDYRLHPALLDACLQTMGAIVPVGRKAGHLPLPVGLERLVVYRRIVGAFWCHATLRASTATGETSFLADLLLVDDHGQLLAELTGMQLRMVSRAALIGTTHDPLQDWFYKTEWRVQERAGATHEREPDVPGDWLIFADTAGLAAQLGRALEAQDDQCIFVEAAHSFRRISAGSFTIDPDKVADYGAVLQEMRLRQRPLKGVVHVWGVDAAWSDVDLATPARHICGSVLGLVQSLVDHAVNSVIKVKVV